MSNFKGIIMSEYASKLTILCHFLHDACMSPKPIASAGCDTTLLLFKKLTFQIKIYTQLNSSRSILFYF